jgi:hypothetical protein
MTDRELGAFTPEDARLVLDTVRRVNQSGILQPGHFERLLRKLPLLTNDGGGTRLQHFKLIENVTGATVQGRRCSPSGTLIDPAEDPTDLVNWANLLENGTTDYVGLYAEIDEEWVFVQGPCIPEPEPEEAEEEEGEEIEEVQEEEI